MRQSLREKATTSAQGFSASPGEKPRRLRFPNIAALTSQACSSLTLVSHSYLSCVASLVAEETTNQLK